MLYQHKVISASPILGWVWGLCRVVRTLAPKILMIRIRHAQLIVMTMLRGISHTLILFHSAPIMPELLMLLLSFLMFGRDNLIWRRVIRYTFLMSLLFLMRGYRNVIFGLRIILCALRSNGLSWRVWGVSACLKLIEKSWILLKSCEYRSWIYPWIITIFNGRGISRVGVIWLHVIVILLLLFELILSEARLSRGISWRARIFWLNILSLCMIVGCSLLIVVAWLWCGCHLLLKVSSGLSANRISLGGSSSRCYSVLSSAMTWNFPAPAYYRGVDWILGAIYHKLRGLGSLGVMFLLRAMKTLIVVMMMQDLRLYDCIDWRNTHTSTFAG